MPLVLEALDQGRGASLIYARTRRSVERWAERLRELNVPATPYHAGLEPEARREALTLFLEHERPVLVATVAFGMGVDRPDVGLVLHLDLPSTPEGYLQESGRAGRDGQPAFCLVLFSPGIAPVSDGPCRRPDVALTPWKTIGVSTWPSSNSGGWKRWQGEMCREQALLLAVGELVEPCGRCDRCTSHAKRRDWSSQAHTLLTHLEERNGMDIRRLGERLELLEPDAVTAGPGSLVGWFRRS